MQSLWTGCGWSMFWCTSNWVVLDKLGTYYKRNVEGAIRSQENDRTSQHEYAGVKHEALLVPALLYINETVVRRKKE